MKISRISFIVLIELICLVQFQIILTEGLENFGGLETCLEFTNPLNQYESKNVECPTVKSSSSSLDKRASDNMFDINFKCTISDKDLCDKVENVFNMAGKYITNTLNLKSTINVDAQLVDFCKEMGYCDTSEVVLGAARPSRMLPFQDSDGKTRLYPQALYKQLDVNNHPTFGPSDIKAIFNSRMDYWFRGDPTPMPTNKADILYVVIHEMIHGLGFTNSWNDYANKQALTPTVVSSSTGSAGSTQFAEYVFDRHLVLLQSGTPLTSITDELNQFKSDTTDPDVFFSSFQASPQFSIAQAMYKNATTHGAIGFLLSSDTPSNNQLSQDQINSSVLILETSLNPYEPSSSLGHVDMQTYIQTSDFLMMFTYPPGETLDDMMSRAGSTDTGPIGPKLKQLLGILGYNTDKKYTPPEGSNASFISFNLSLFLVCIFLTFINNL